MARIRALLRNLFHRDAVERELDEELRSYCEMLEDEKVAGGTAPDVARRQARVALGGLQQVKEEVRAIRAGAIFDGFVQDLRYGARLIRRAPVFTLVATVTLAVGIGANAAIFSVVNAVLLRPLPFASPDSLFRVTGLSYTGELLELQRRAQTFDVAGYRQRQATLTGDGEPAQLSLASVSPNFMTLVGTPTILGRALRTGDDTASSGQVVIISHPLWRARFGGDPRIVGRTVTIDGLSRTIVGVMPGDFVLPSTDTAFWVTEPIDTTNRVALWSTSFEMVGRLRPGATLAGAAAEIRRIAPAMRGLFPWSMPADYGTGAGVVRIQESLVRNVRSQLLLLAAAVASVLLIAAVNVSNLLIGRSLARQREMAIRASLGAARGRLLRQSLTEATLLVLIGCVLALPIAYAGIHLLASSLPAEMPRRVALVLDRRMLLFAAACLTASALVVGGFPAIRVSRAEPLPGLADSERAGTGRHSRWMSNLLIGAQMALAVMLVIAAALLGRSLGNLSAVSTGFSAQNVVTARMSPPQFRFGDPASRRKLYRDALERLAALPGVTSVAAADRLPFGGGIFGTVFMIEGRPDPSKTGDWPLAEVSSIVTPAFFSTLRIPLREGRVFTSEDTETSQPVAVINETLAHTYWPGKSPLGRRFSFPGRRAVLTVVGVVGDVKWGRVTDDAKGALYVPLSQGSPGAMRLIVRADKESAAVTSAIRSVVRSIDSETALDQMVDMNGLIASSMEGSRFAAWLMGSFAIAGLALGAIGIYGTVVEHVSRRRREIGVRMALGARPRHLLNALVGRILLVVAAGTAVGLVAAVALSQLVRSMLFGIAATDTVTFLGAPLLLLLIAALAGYVPARRAAALDPLTVLRTD